MHTALTIIRNRNKADFLIQKRLSAFLQKSTYKNLCRTMNSFINTQHKNLQGISPHPLILVLLWGKRPFKIFNVGSFFMSWLHLLYQLHRFCSCLNWMLLVFKEYIFNLFFPVPVGTDLRYAIPRCIFSVMKLHQIPSLPSQLRLVYSLIKFFCNYQRQNK